MTITDQELNDLSAEKQMVVKNFDRGYIDEPTYNNQLKDVQQRIDSKVAALLENNKKENKIEPKEDNKMSEEQQVEKKAIGRKPVKNSYATAIASVLQMKSIKDVDQAVEKLEEVKPGRDKAKNISQIKTIIREVKKGKGRWSKYTWDEEAYLLTEKE